MFLAIYFKSDSKEKSGDISKDLSLFIKKDLIRYFTYGHYKIIVTYNNVDRELDTQEINNVQDVFFVNENGSITCRLCPSNLS